ncbi:hypothetical protein PFISCL1PPCAC_6054 [Pristionchus fissidentatus]|uniref:ferroxidase n=1 Tax=Pristionchus fissidentatus TaxID=1538716 RepID=A0AAV5V951_9BILA|nr:hypothetical protein PFISCL1PPCAC_6054 [Pristionchus fissidentatus]
MLSVVSNIRFLSRISIRGVCSIPESDLRVYEKRADETLESISDYVSEIGEAANVDVDIALSMGVLSLSIPPVGTFVLNKQRPNLQLWLSSPISGPRRYDLKSGKWICAREHEALHLLLNREFTQIFPSTPVDFSSYV